MLLEAPDGFIVQGLVVHGGNTGTWSDTVGTQTKETLTFLDDDIARFMEEAAARRGARAAPRPTWPVTTRRHSAFSASTSTTRSLRDIFFFEQDGAFVLRLLMAGQAGRPATCSPNSPGRTSPRLVAAGPTLRQPVAMPGDRSEHDQRLTRR